MLTWTFTERGFCPWAGEVENVEPGPDLQKLHGQTVNWDLHCFHYQTVIANDALQDDYLCSLLLQTTQVILCKDLSKHEHHWLTPTRVDSLLKRMLLVIGAAVLRVGYFIISMMIWKYEMAPVSLCPVSKWLYWANYSRLEANFCQSDVWMWWMCGNS